MIGRFPEVDFGRGFIDEIDSGRLIERPFR
jgi:hypothetical protein